MLRDNHFCYVIFKEMNPLDFLSLMELNVGLKNMVFLDYDSNLELYSEAKGLILQGISNKTGVVFDFAYESEPFVFNKFINGQLDRQYKICIFEVKKEKRKTSDVYCDKMPIFYDPNGDIIKNSLN